MSYVANCISTAIDSFLHCITSDELMCASRSQTPKEWQSAKERKLRTEYMRQQQGKQVNYTQDNSFFKKSCINEVEFVPTTLLSRQKQPARNIFTSVPVMYNCYIYIHVLRYIDTLLKHVGSSQGR